MHTSSSAERGIFRTDDISQIGRVTQLFSENHRNRESAKAAVPSVEPPIQSSIAKGTTSTRNISYTYDQYNFVPVPGLKNHGIDGVPCDAAERTMIGKKYVSREEAAAAELLVKEQKKKESRKKHAVQACLDEIDRFTFQQQQRVDEEGGGGGSADSDDSENVVRHKTAGPTKRQSAVGGDRRIFSDVVENSPKPSGAVNPTNIVTTTHHAAETNLPPNTPPAPTEARLRELAGSYLHSLAIDCTTDEIVALYFRVVCGLDSASAVGGTVDAVSKTLYDEVDNLQSSHHMLGIPPGAIPTKPKVSALAVTSAASDKSSPASPSASQKKTSFGTSLNTDSPTSPSKTSPLYLKSAEPDGNDTLTGAMQYQSAKQAASPSKFLTSPQIGSTAPSPLKSRGDSWARNGPRSSISASVVDDVFGDRPTAEDLAPPKKFSLNNNNTNNHHEDEAVCQQAEKEHQQHKKVGFAHGDGPFSGASDAVFDSETPSPRRPFPITVPDKAPTSIVKSSSHTFGAPKPSPTTDGLNVAAEEDALDSAGPQRQYLLGGAPNPLSAISISNRLASAFSSLVSEVLEEPKPVPPPPPPSTAGTDRTQAQKDASKKLLMGKPTHSTPPRQTIAVEASAPPKAEGSKEDPPARREDSILRSEVIEIIASSAVSGAAVLGSCYDVVSAGLLAKLPAVSRRAVLLARQHRLIAALQRNKKALSNAAWNSSLPSHSGHPSLLPDGSPVVLPSYSVAGVHRARMPLSEVIGPNEFHQLCVACILFGKEKKRRAADSQVEGQEAVTAILDVVELGVTYHKLKEDIRERLALKEADEEQLRISVIELQELEEQRRRGQVHQSGAFSSSMIGGGGSVIHNSSQMGFTAFPLMLDLNQLEDSDARPHISEIHSSGDDEEKGSDGEEDEFQLNDNGSDEDSPGSPNHPGSKCLSSHRRFSSPGLEGPTSSHISTKSPQKIEKGSTMHTIMTMQRQRRKVLEEISKIKVELERVVEEERAALASACGPSGWDMYDTADGSIAIPTPQTATQLGFERLLGIYRPPGLMGVNADEVASTQNGNLSQSRRGSMRMDGGMDNRSFGSMADLNLMRSPSTNSLLGGTVGSSKNLHKLRLVGGGGTVTEEALSGCNVTLYAIVNSLASASRLRADTKRRIAYFVRSFMPQSGWPLSAMFLSKESPKQHRSHPPLTGSPNFRNARLSLAGGNQPAPSAGLPVTAANLAQQQASVLATMMKPIQLKAHHRDILQLILNPNPQTQAATAQLVSLLGSATGITDYNNHRMVLAALGSFLFNSTVLHEFLIPKTSASSALRGPSTTQASILRRLGKNKSPVASPKKGPHPPQTAERNTDSSATSLNGGAAVARPYASKQQFSSLSPRHLRELDVTEASPAPRPPPPQGAGNGAPNFLLRPHFSQVVADTPIHMLSTLMMGGGNTQDGAAPRAGSGGAASVSGVSRSGTAQGGQLNNTANSSSRMSIRRSTLRGSTLTRRQSVSVLSPTNGQSPIHRASISNVAIPGSPSTSHPAHGFGAASSNTLHLRHQQQLERTAYFLSQCVPANIFNPHFVMYFIEEHLRPLVKVVEKISNTTPNKIAANGPPAPQHTNTAQAQNAAAPGTDNNNNNNDAPGTLPHQPEPQPAVYPISATAVNTWLSLCEDYLLPLTLLVLNRYHDVFAALPDWTPVDKQADMKKSAKTVVGQRVQAKPKSLKSKMIDSIRSYLSQRNESVRTAFDRKKVGMSGGQPDGNHVANTANRQSNESNMKELEEALLAGVSPDLREQFLASIDPFVMLIQTSATHISPKNSREYNVSVIASANKAASEFASVLANDGSTAYAGRSGGFPQRRGDDDTFLLSNVGPVIPPRAGTPTREELEAALYVVDGPALAAAARTMIHYGSTGAGGLFGDGSHTNSSDAEASSAADLLNSDMLSNAQGVGGGGASAAGGGRSGQGGNKGSFSSPFDSQPTDAVGNQVRPVMVMSVDAAATMCIAVPILRHFFEHADGW